MVIVPPPTLHDDASFCEGVIDLAIEKLVAEPSVEALDIAAFPWVP